MERGLCFKPSALMRPIARHYWGLLVDLFTYKVSSAVLALAAQNSWLIVSHIPRSQGHDSFIPLVFSAHLQRFSLPLYSVVLRSCRQLTRHAALRRKAEHPWDTLLPTFPMKWTAAPLSCVWACFQNTQVSHNKFPTAGGISLI